MGGERSPPKAIFFLLLAEAGLPAILLFVGTMFALYSEATRFGDPCQRYVIVLVGVASCFVHAITYPAFFGIWGILLGGTRQRVLKKKTRRPAPAFKKGLIRRTGRTRGCRNRSMKIVLIHCYSDNNKGDLGIILATIQLLRAATPSVTITAVSTFEEKDPYFTS